MCGIFGYMGQLDLDLGLRCLRTLAHRGPDGEGFHRTDGLFLGHRRLAILDLSERGKQPMSYAEGRYWITFNGEIYNFIEIRKDLIKKGHRFKSESDTELLLASYAEWGEKCLDKLNGMWAFAIWDGEKRELFLSRDRFGKKPLFYAFIAGDFVFASEMKAITPLMEKLEPDSEIVMDSRRLFFYEGTDRCLVKGINRFPAGSYARLRDGGRLEFSRYWQTLDNLVDVPPTYEEQAERFRELFVDACRMRMRSDVPIGTALSGGVDSSAVFCALKYLGAGGAGDRATSDWQHAFCASFPGTPLDEAKWARAVANYCGTDINVIEMDPGAYLDRFFEDIYCFEDLYITPHIPFVATYAEMRRSGVVVTIDGHGADELFGGYGWDYLHILRDNIFNIKNSLKVIDAYYDSRLPDRTQFEALPSKAGFFVKESIRNLGRKLLGSEKTVRDRHSRWRTLDSFTRQLYSSFHETTLPTLLRNYDRYSMINGVEIRMPFMDHRLVAYAFSLPWESKIRNGYTKAIIRDGLSAIMPHEVAYRKYKIGFNPPVVDWFKGPMKQFLLDAIASQEFKDNPFVDSVAAGQKMTKAVCGAGTSFQEAMDAWKMVSPFFWCKGFLRKAGA